MATRRLRQEDLDRYRRNNLGQSLMEVARHFQKHAMEAFLLEGHTGLQAAHQAVLTHLSLSGSRLTELAKRASMTKQAMGQLVDEVESLGYVERIPDPTDRRAKLVRFTRKGDDLMKSATHVGDSIQKRYTEIIGEKKMDRLRTLLDELYGNLRKQESGGDGQKHG